MSEITEYLITIDVDASGASTDTVGTAIFGQLYAVDVVNGTLANNFDITLSYANSQGVSHTLVTFTNLSADGLYYPRHVVHSEAAAALTGTSGGDRAMPLIAGTVTAVTADGGVSKSGALILYVIED